MEVIDPASGLRYSRAERLEALMRRWILSVMAAVAVFSASALAQATMETLMTHSVSTGVGTHAGTALGRATNALAGKVAQQTSATTSRVGSPQTVSAPRSAAAARRGQTAPAANVWAPDTPLPGNGSLIASIQGGEPRSKSCAGSAKAATAGAAPPNCTAPAPHAVDHPSVVNLPAPQ